MIRDRETLDILLANIARFVRERLVPNEQRVAETDEIPADIMYLARQFPAGDDCRWCSFYLKGDKEMKRGCPGK